MSENTVKKKSFDFAIRIMELQKQLIANKEFIVSRQVVRSGTAIGALIREAEHAESKADFIHKMSIALKEANETHYWLELLYKSDYIEEKLFQSLIKDAEEVLKMLISIVKTSKLNLKRKP